MAHKNAHEPKAPTQRQLRAGEIIRHALVTLLARGDLRDPELEKALITVSEVRMSSDLRVAKVYVAPLGPGEPQALAKALGDKKGLTRYGHAYVPLDEALSRVVVDLSGRPGLTYEVTFARSHIGDFEVDLIREFFQAVINHAAITVHIDNLRGANAHHQAETIFKAFARALRMASRQASCCGRSPGCGVSSTSGATTSNARHSLASSSPRYFEVDARMMGRRAAEVMA